MNTHPAPLSPSPSGDVSLLYKKQQDDVELIPMSKSAPFATRPAFIILVPGLEDDTFSAGGTCINALCVVRNRYLIRYQCFSTASCETEMVAHRPQI
jgi:hypothetical protein